MNFISLAAFMALSTGAPSPTPAAQVVAACCSANSAEAPVKVAQADGYLCPLTGAILPCPSCCPAKARTTR
ncbi:MAG: hypothetical protein NVSMB9_34580 [Isosphaeraceae bacterium]